MLHKQQYEHRSVSVKRAKEGSGRKLAHERYRFPIDDGCGLFQSCCELLLLLPSTRKSPPTPIVVSLRLGPHLLLPGGAAPLLLLAVFSWQLLGALYGGPDPPLHNLVHIW